MKTTRIILVALSFGLLLTNSGAEEKQLSISEVLQHTPEELAKELGNRSETGENRAAKLWTAAKRAQTDSILGKKSVQAMQRLNKWREVLNKWADLKIRARGIKSGGGTMWGHMSARNDAWIEAFLAKHMTALSAERKSSGKPFKSDYLNTIHATIDSGVKEWGKDMPHINTMAASTKEQLKNTYSYLQYMLGTLPEGELKKAVVEMVKPSAE